jgi:hypothetical protein
MRIKPMLGSFQLTGIEYVESSESRALVEHRVPGLAGNYFQDLGSVPNRIVVAGTHHGDEARDAFLNGVRELFNSGQPTTFTADINTATDLVDVVVEDLEVAEVGGSASGFRYVLTLRKYIKPPEPAPTGLLDAGLLDDALGAIGAMDLLDSLVSIPSFGDPSVPLQGVMDGVKDATGGLADAAAPLQAALGNAGTDQGTNERE